MSFDIEKFCQDYHISNSRNVSKGWINIKCPFCEDRSFHLGINIDKGYSSCFRCGGHWLPKVIAAILKTSISQAKNIIKPYLSGEQIQEFKEKIYAERLIYPPDTGPMNQKQRSYLESRRFDPEELEQDWGLLGVGRVGPYKGRILVPIYLHGRLISYQTRDTTGKSSARYMACSEKEEVYCHKYSLYGIDNCYNKTVIVVEGPFDVYRLGFGAVGTFGIEFTSQQVLMLARRFDRIFIFYDNEDQAQQKANEMANDLAGFGKEVEIIMNPDGDPGDLSDNEAKKLMKDLMSTTPAYQR